MTVGQRFDAFLDTLKLTEDQVNDGATKHAGVRRCLNEHYYSSTSESANSVLIGSWGKFTRVRPPRDIDVLFELPASVHQRYVKRQGNKQSQILQEVKEVLIQTYTRTEMRADGQVVLVPFATYAVEVVPAFKLTDGRYWICNANVGGSYEVTDPDAEFVNIKESDEKTKGNTRDLIRMMKRWQEYCNVPLKSFVIELLAIEFLRGWSHAGNSTTYYDWMVRDFFKWLIGQANGIVIVPGSYKVVSLATAWVSRAETAYGRAVKATVHEASNEPYSAGAEWQKIFGTDIPQG